MDQLSNLEYQTPIALMSFQQIERGNSLRFLSARCLFNISPVRESRDFSNEPTENLVQMAQARKRSLICMKLVLNTYENWIKYLCVHSARRYQARIYRMINDVKKTAKEFDLISKILTEEREYQEIRSSHFEMTIETMMNNFITKQIVADSQSSKVVSQLKKFSSINKNWRRNPSAVSFLRNPSTINNKSCDYIVNRREVLGNEIVANRQNRRSRAANLNRGLYQNDNQGASDNSFDLTSLDEALPAVLHCSGQKFCHVYQNDNSFDLTSLDEALPTVQDSSKRKAQMRMLEDLKQPFYREKKLLAIQFLDNALKSLSYSLQSLD